LIKKKEEKMGKIVVLVCMVMSLFFAHVVLAEDYVSKDFPSTATIERACAADLAKVASGAKLGRFFGKTQNSTAFEVYFEVRNQGNSGINSWTLYKLDSNLWLIKSIGTFQSLSVLQK
jgi:hypothetical protein